VADVTAKGYNVGSAFAICTKAGQRAGYFKAGTRDLTPKGQAADKALRRKPGYKEKVTAYKMAIGEALCDESAFWDTLDAHGQIVEFTALLDEML
jgi:hypothetical protein